jgi:hypothetical protein
MDFRKAFDKYISFVLGIKILFLIVSAVEVLLNFVYRGKLDLKKVMFISTIDKLKENVELLFIVSAAFYLIYNFFIFGKSKNNSVIVNGEEKIILFALGVVLLLNATTFRTAFEEKSIKEEQKNLQKLNQQQQQTQPQQNSLQTDSQKQSTNITFMTQQ